MRSIPILCLTMPLVMSVTSRATVRHVPDNHMTIQNAIDNASNGDTVLVADGVYRGEGNRDIVFGDIDLLVTSSSGPDACIIDCEGSNEDRHNAFNFTQYADIELSGFAIINGFFVSGGAIAAGNSSPRIQNCVFYNNHAWAMGGAIAIVNSSIDTIANCLFIGNTAQDGGAVFVHNSSPTIYQSSFIENVGIAQITTENYAYPAVHYCLFVGSTVHSWPECCPSDPVVGPSGNFPFNCINFRYGTYTDLWNVDNARYFDIDPQICSQDPVNYKVYSTSPCLPENNQFNKRIGYQSEVCTPAGIENDDGPPAIPDSPVLHQNYPNPFNPVTTIRISLPSETQVTLDVFNVMGQKVSTLVNGPMDVGEHHIQWDGRTDSGQLAATGVYCYRLRAGDLIDTKKMLLLK